MCIRDSTSCNFKIKEQIKFAFDYLVILCTSPTTHFSYLYPSGILFLTRKELIGHLHVFPLGFFQLLLQLFSQSELSPYLLKRLVPVSYTHLTLPTICSV
eukprot:TRINITY_DN14666_c0_g1_i1.p1 TRINITY_DN14666_c0_g1~~TRINITY_DN14666_c0_g1_i1.p1  ORF type:complete len:100 (+),score=6.86 TRINITY_DN14666_c0_g1_i1:73-372(+)